MKLTQRQLSTAVRKGGFDAFFCGASYEERSGAISEVVAKALPKAKAVVFCSDRHTESIEPSRQKITALFGSRAASFQVSISKPLETLDVMGRALDELKLSAKGTILVDITTFTHEHIALLSRLLASRDLLHRCAFAYTSAVQYGFAAKNARDIWLSRGAASVRPVLGYPGMLRPSKRVHIIVLVGFEAERAQVALDANEPEYISIGIGDRNDSISAALHETNRIFYDRVQGFLATKREGMGKMREFSFSCTDPASVAKTITEEAQAFGDDTNVVVFPMNTKVSTLGAIIAALEQPAIQLGYVEPIEYNVGAYSKGADGFRFFSAESLGFHRRKALTAR